MQEKKIKVLIPTYHSHLDQGGRGRMDRERLSPFGQVLPILLHIRRGPYTDSSSPRWSHPRASVPVFAPFLINESRMLAVHFAQGSVSSYWTLSVQVGDLSNSNLKGMQMRRVRNSRSYLLVIWSDVLGCLTLRPLLIGQHWSVYNY